MTRDDGSRDQNPRSALAVSLVTPDTAHRRQTPLYWPRKVHDLSFESNHSLEKKSDLISAGKAAASYRARGERPAKSKRARSTISEQIFFRDLPQSRPAQQKHSVPARAIIYVVQRAISNFDDAWIHRHVARVLDCFLNPPSR